MRTVEIKDTKIEDYHSKIKEIWKDGQKLLDEKEKLEKEIKKTALKIQKIKDKLNPAISKYLGALAEFEYVANLDVIDGKLVAKVGDQLEEFKDAYRKQKVEQAKKA